MIAIKRYYNSYQKANSKEEKSINMLMYLQGHQQLILKNMAIKFTEHKTPRPKDNKEKLIHARAVAGQTRKMDDICKVICQRSSISSADVKAVLDSFVWYIGFSLKYGDHVELEELGYFSPSLRTRKQPDGQFLVTVDGVNFRCSENLKKELRIVKLEKKTLLQTYSPQKREERMVEHFKEHKTITTPIYAKLNACSHYRAKADLESYLKKNILIRIGGSTHVSYLLNENILQQK